MIDKILEFIADNYFMFIYGLALILSFVKYKYYYATHLKALPIIIGYVLLTEILGYLIWEYEDIQIVYAEGQHYYNNLIYNILDIIFFLYFFWIYERSFSNDNFKKLIGYGAIVFLIVTLINPFFQSFVLYTQLASVAIGSLIICTCSFIYLIQTKIDHSKFSNFNYLLWWISIGFILFYPFYPIILFIGEFNEKLFFELHLKSVLVFLIALLYGSICIGFLKLGKTYSN